MLPLTCYFDAPLLFPRSYKTGNFPHHHNILHLFFICRPLMLWAWSQEMEMDPSTVVCGLVARSMERSRVLSSGWRAMFRDTEENLHIPALFLAAR